MEERNDIQFINEITLNDYTIREIGLGLWSYRKGKNKLPVILLLLALCCPVIVTFVTGNKDAIMLIVPILVAGLIALFGYLGYSAHKAAKLREEMIAQMLKEYGTSAVLQISINNQISYTFDQKTRAAEFVDIEKVIELDMYLVLILKNKVELPIWKAGFTKGNWDDFIPYLKKKTRK